MVNLRSLYGHLLAATCLFALGGCATGPSRTSSRHGQPDSPPRDDWARRDRGDRGDRPGHGELGQLARELDSRTSRADQLAGQLPAGSGRGEREFVARLRRFSAGTRQFQGELERGELAGGRLNGAFEHLLNEARETDRSLRQGEVSREMLEEWQGIERILERMRSLVQG
jgi:hypothetical protein